MHQATLTWAMWQNINRNLSLHLSISFNPCLHICSLRFSLSFSWQTVVLQCNNTCNLIARWHESRWRKLFHVTALIKTKTITPTPTAAQKRLCICVCIYWSVSKNKCLFLSVLTNRSLIFQAFIFLSVIANLLGVFFSCRLCFPDCLSVCLSFSLSLSLSPVSSIASCVSSGQAVRSITPQKSARNTGRLYNVYLNVCVHSFTALLFLFLSRHSSSVLKVVYLLV